MFDQGIVEEVKGLLSRGIPEQAAPFKGLGYRQVLSYLKGEISLEEAIYLTKLDTRHFAKRQLTWFKKSPGIIWLESEDRPGIKDIIEKEVLG
jgi:tRNA dimethylallyltransferase